MFLTDPEKNTHCIHPYIKFPASILLLFFLLAGATVNSAPSKNYLHIEQSKLSDENDLEITSLGALVFRGNKAGHINLTRLESKTNGDGLALEFGGGFVYNWDVSLFLGFGVTLGVNSDSDDSIAAYYPEIGVVMDITKTLGITASHRRYHNLYEENGDVVMLGLVFRN
jgi:hypothetical protein